jgi:hypothetical protein
MKVLKDAAGVVACGEVGGPSRRARWVARPGFSGGQATDRGCHHLNSDSTRFLQARDLDSNHLSQDGFTSVLNHLDSFQVLGQS